MSETQRDLHDLVDPPPGRASALAGGLGPRRQASPPPPRDPDTGDDGQTVVGERAPERPARRRATPKSSAPGASSRKKPWTIYVPEEVVDQVEAVLAGQPWSAWVLDAYRHVHARLNERFVAPEPDDSGLPPRPMGARRDVGHPREKQLKLTDAEIRVLDSKIEGLGGPTRSAVMTAVCELRLEQLRGS